MRSGFSAQGKPVVRSDVKAGTRMFEHIRYGRAEREGAGTNPQIERFIKIRDLEVLKKNSLL
jgi:hypothetical protein